MIETKKTEEKTEAAYDVKVTRASQYSDNAFAFNMEVNGITIYDCWFKQGVSKKGNNYTFVDFPTKKGKDGKYYNEVFFPINAELLQEIERQIAALIGG